MICDGRLAHPILQIVKRKIQALEKKLGFGAALAAHDIEIEPGAKHLVRAADDHRAHRFVVPRLLQPVQQGVYQWHAQRIDRRAVECDLRNRIRDGVANEFGSHGALVSGWFGLACGGADDASLDQIVDRLAVKPCIPQYLAAIRPDTRRRAQIVFGKAREARGAR